MQTTCMQYCGSLLLELLIESTPFLRSIDVKMSHKLNKTNTFPAADTLSSDNPGGVERRDVVPSASTAICSARAKGGALRVHL